MRGAARMCAAGKGLAWAGLLATALAAAGCDGARTAGPESPEARETARPAGADPRARTGVPQAGAARIAAARIISTTRPLECVPYVRRISGVAIRGDAWTWWHAAAGRYHRDNRPAVGSVLVLERTSRLRYGHVAVVSRIVGSREILVDHANWLNRGRIHRDLPVVDVSPGNDWSVVRVWYAPGGTLGKRRYPAYGFIHARPARTLRLSQPTMRGPDVRALQERLIRKGLNVAADGVFGPGTRDALAAYQGRIGLVRDGVAGPTTRASLGI